MGYHEICGRTNLHLQNADALQAYLAERARSRFAGSEFLFLGQRGPPSVRRSQHPAGEVGPQVQPAGSAETAHLQAPFCTRLVQQGVLLTTVSKLAGYINVETASFYVNSSREEKMQAVNMF